MSTWSWTNEDCLKSNTIFWIEFLMEKRKFWHKCAIGSKLVGHLGEIVSLQSQTSSYFQLKERFKIIEHISKGTA